MQYNYTMKKSNTRKLDLEPVDHPFDFNDVVVGETYVAYTDIYSSREFNASIMEVLGDNILDYRRSIKVRTNCDENDIFTHECIYYTRELVGFNIITLSEIEKVFTDEELFHLRLSTNLIGIVTSWARKKLESADQI